MEGISQTRTFLVQYGSAGGQRSQSQFYVVERNKNNNDGLLNCECKSLIFLRFYIQTFTRVCRFCKGNNSGIQKTINIK